MSTHAAGTFEIETWDEKPYDEQDGTKLTRTHLTKTFHGDIEGTSTAEMLMAYGAVDGSAAYTGFERVTASVHGRSGSFVLHHSATTARGALSSSLSVVPDSGTGDLRGLRGEARISNEPDGGHSFSLDYILE
ncbi:MAG TPA: DUF3224 domain-containing protein [Rubrobacteraceae bacterium]|nr:DUF3224 domain-containing protein [Rubrobacteraceae bacterium]